MFSNIFPTGSDPKLSEVPEKEENKLSTVVVMKELVHNIPFMLFLVISFFFWGACSTNFNYLSLFIKSQGGTAFIKDTARPDDKSKIQKLRQLQK